LSLVVGVAAELVQLILVLVAAVLVVFCRGIFQLIWSLVLGMRSLSALVAPEEAMR
jgi:hypothetical protein